VLFLNQRGNKAKTTKEVIALLLNQGSNKVKITKEIVIVVTRN
jgi:hypothetical protein